MWSLYFKSFLVGIDCMSMYVLFEFFFFVENNEILIVYSKMMNSVNNKFEFGNKRIMIMSS